MSSPTETIQQEYKEIQKLKEQFKISHEKAIQPIRSQMNKKKHWHI